jgi:hypothetical protein
LPPLTQTPPPPPPPLFKIEDHFSDAISKLLPLPPRTRDDAIAAAAPAAAAVRFLSRCLLLHAVKFSRKREDAETWLAVAANGISQQELKAALGHDFHHVMGCAGEEIKLKLKPAGFTVPILQAFCALSCVSMLDDSFGFTLKEVRESGVTVKMLLQEELRLYPKVVDGRSAAYSGNVASHYGHPKLKMLDDFVRAGYDEAEVRSASSETNVAVFVFREGRQCRM